jgi:NAD(P)H-flavin reductase
LFADELNAWRKESRLWVGVTVDRSATGWTGNVGPVTALLHRKDLPSDGLYLICGPEVMMRVVIRLLENAGVPAENIYLSMERNMQCAAGFCGRCQFGPYFICKDGPVFRYDEVAFLFGREGF